MRKAPVPSFLRVLTVGCLLAAAVGVVARPASAVTLFTVDSANDGGDSNLLDDLCNDGTAHCTLRAAIQQANSSAGAQTIDFNIPTRPKVIPVIQPGSALPAASGQTIVDGTSQPGVHHVILDGTNAPSGSGFVFTGPSCTLRGFTVQAFAIGNGVLGQGANLTIAGNVIGTVTGSGGNHQGIVSAGTNAIIGGTTAADRNVISGNLLNGIVDENSGDVIEGNYIGTNVAGTAAAPNGIDGIAVFSSSATIGPGNVISGNTHNGVEFQSSLAHNDTLKGNLIGTNATGAAAVPNQLSGVFLTVDTHGNAIGVAGGGNVISGNSGSGVVAVGATTAGNTVKGNLVGTNAAGTAAIGNETGVLLIDVSGMTVGGTTAAERNVISGNDTDGVEIQRVSGAPTNNLVEGNYIGTNAAGTAAVPNDTGVLLLTADDNAIGGVAAGAGNLISGNRTDGVDVAAGGNTVIGNRIGTDAAGASAIANGGSGVSVTGAANAISGNLVSGNTVEGISLDGDGASGNSVTGNLVGTDASGAAAVPNGDNGIFVDASDNHIGGTTAADRNVISGNGGTGIVIFKVTSSVPPAGNTIEGNYVGVSASGSAPLGNTLNGIFVFQAGGNDIGGTDPGSGNVISANARGLYVSLSGPGTVVYGNLIGTNAAGTSTAGFGNLGVGIRVEGCTGTTIGGSTASSRNVISGNGAEGIDLEVSTATDIVGNSIGTDKTGTLDLGNIGDGVLASASPKNTIGGTKGGEGNVISGNDANGVHVAGNTSKSNKVLGNLIGTQQNGTSPLANTGDGVLIDGKAGKTTVGGTKAGARNVIANNGLAGVFVDSGKGNAIRQNAISANGALGIDLNPTGVNPNDAGDPDTGANLGQNYPVVTSAVAGGGTTTVGGTLNSTASATFSVDVFWGPTRDPSLFGEGQTYLGTLTATTNASGNVTFSTALGGAIPAGSWVTMTATDAKGNTSEFSQAKKST